MDDLIEQLAKFLELRRTSPIYKTVIDSVLGLSGSITVKVKNGGTEIELYSSDQAQVKQLLSDVLGSLKK